MLDKQKLRFWRFFGLVLGGSLIVLGAEAQQTDPSSSPKLAQKAETQNSQPKSEALSVAAPSPTNRDPYPIMTPFGPIHVIPPVQANAQSSQTPPSPQQSAPPAKPDTAQAQDQSNAPSPPSSTTPPAAQPNAQASAVALNLENADLYQVLRIIGSELKINYVVDPSVKGTVTINTAGSVSRSDLFSILQSILQVNGAAIVKGDGYYRVVPISEAKLSALPLEFAKAPEAAPSPGETLVLQVIPMHFVPAKEMSKVLTPFVSPAGEIVLSEQANVLLIVEAPAKLKQISEIVRVFDSPTFSRQRVQVFPVANNSARSLITELQNVFAGYALSGTSAIRFVPLESMNAVLAISPSPEVFEDIQQWISRLDQPPREVGIQNFVYMVQNAKAADLRDILIQLYGGEVPKPQAPPSPATPPNPMVSPQVLEEQEKAQAPPARERVQGSLRIMSDDKNNALIVQATPHDYEIVKRTLVQLDILPRQVLIDAKIYEVELTGNLSMGISAFLQNNASLTSPPSSIGSFSGGQAGGSLQAQTFAIIGATRTLQLFLNATENSGRVRILSDPSILVTDNGSARIQIGAQIPVPIGSALTPIQANGTSLFAQTIQYVDTGVILTVTPHINASGIVLLTISQEVSSAAANTTSQIVAPIINKNAFQTSVVLSDGEPLALGGIISTTVSYNRDRIPILGDIPKLGALFGNTSKNTSRTELVLLLTPHVLRDVPAAAANTQEFLSHLAETRKAMEQLK
jgi:general secretion pathway protein D